MKSLIIDDDPKSHKILKGLLEEEHPDIQVLDSGYDIDEGFDLILKYQPDLVFLDIEMPGGLGFDLLRRVPNPDFYVIFITAYDKYAVRAIRFGALDFLVKPIDPEDLSEALKKATNLQKQKISHEQLQVLVEAYQKAQTQELPTRIAIASVSDISYVSIDKIVYLEASGGYTRFYIDEPEGPIKIMASTNLGKYIDQFKPYRKFIQVHRSYMLNTNYVKKYIKNDQIVLLKNGNKIDVGQKFLKAFRQAMEEL